MQVSEHDADAVAGDLPPMPRPSPRAFGDVPLQSGASHTLGIKVRSRDKAFYFLAARGALRRYGRRFPLTEEGWLEAWTAGIGWLCAVALGYEGIRHVSTMLVLLGAALAFCSLVATLFGVVAEGIRLARRTS